MVRHITDRYNGDRQRPKCGCISLEAVVHFPGIQRLYAEQSCVEAYSYSVEWRRLLGFIQSSRLVNGFNGFINHASNEVDIVIRNRSSMDTTSLSSNRRYIKRISFAPWSSTQIISNSPLTQSLSTLEYYIQQPCSPSSSFSSPSSPCTQPPSSYSSPSTPTRAPKAPPGPTSPPQSPPTPTSNTK